VKPTTHARRKTQKERSQNTKAALMEATIECLAELGYKGTSTTEIAKRAKVSRGAQVHHFPTKRDLVINVVKYLSESRTKEFVEEFSSIDDADKSLSAAISILWKYFSGPTYQAMLELIVAARSDKELRRSIEPYFRQFQDQVNKIFSDIFPEVANQPFGGSMVAFAFALLQGAAIMNEIGLSDLTEDAVSLLTLVAEVVVPQFSLEEFKNVE
jgi:AcrR family transcriptional regulator